MCDTPLAHALSAHVELAENGRHSPTVESSTIYCRHEEQERNNCFATVHTSTDSGDTLLLWTYRCQYMQLKIVEYRDGIKSKTRQG